MHVEDLLPELKDLSHAAKQRVFNPIESFHKIMGFLPKCLADHPNHPNISFLLSTQIFSQNRTALNSLPEP